MKKKYQNIFFFLGLTMLVVMATQMDYAEVCAGVSRAGYWFLAVIALWFFLYFFNTTAWWLIIRSTSPQPLAKGQTLRAYMWLYRITVSGFALNYATPGGLLGGEPYKIMALSPKLGTANATSTVLLHTMTHIFSHFWFWLLSCVLYIATQPMNVLMGMLIAAVSVFCIAAILFFLQGYKKGFTVSAMQLLTRFPLVKRWARRFFEQHQEQLASIDRQMATLHNQAPRTFLMAVGLELLCRIVSALEIFFILLVIMPSANFVQCILILAFTSLVANMLFFMPLQLGGREGGFLMSVSGLGMTTSAGIFVALLVRLRELIWTAIGLLLIKLDRHA